jgi:hypothetical protein
MIGSLAGGRILPGSAVERGDRSVVYEAVKHGLTCRASR